MKKNSVISEQMHVIGEYTAELFDKNGKLKWRVKFPNLVTTQGKNFLLDNGLAGSAFTATYYLGLISSITYTAIAATDTAASHTGWTEAGATNAPAYSGTRKTAVFSAAAAGAKALSSPLSFTFTSAGTVKGAFLTTTAAIDGTTGALYSAGLFTGGDRAGIVASDILNVSYSTSL